jgi:uncharacterized protein (DUF58 family)
MLVPRNRLLFWFAVVVLPFAFLGAVEPAALNFSVLPIVAFVLLAVMDAFRGRSALAGISLALPAIARMSKEREGKLELRIHNPSQRPRALRLALALPREVESRDEDAQMLLPGDAEWSHFPWRCRPRARGRFLLETARIGSASPLGFWEVRETLRAKTEIRVYPNLLRERKNLAAMFLHRGAAGLHAQRQLGRGREFERLREYIPGDGFDEIHWKATARRARPITKVYQIERTQEVYVVIDASRLSARPVAEQAQDWANPTETMPVATATTVLERFITAALMLGLAAEQQGDFFGLLTFTDKVEHFIRAKNGKAHYNACRDALYTLQPRVVTPDYDEVCTFIRLRLRRRALLIVLTALDDPALAEAFVRNVDLIRRQHLILVNMLQPPGIVPLFSDPRVESPDDLYQHLGGHLLWQKLGELEKVLKRRGVRFSLLKNERLAADLVSQYLSVKRRQAL